MSWCIVVLDFVEQGNLANIYDKNVRWNTGTNATTGQTVLPYSSALPQRQVIVDGLLTHPALTFMAFLRAHPTILSCIVSESILHGQLALLIRLVRRS